MILISNFSAVERHCYFFAYQVQMDGLGTQHLCQPKESDDEFNYEVASTGGEQPPCKTGNLLAVQELPEDPELLEQDEEEALVDDVVMMYFVFVEFRNTHRCSYALVSILSCSPKEQLDDINRLLAETKQADTQVPWLHLDEGIGQNGESRSFSRCPRPPCL